MEVFQTKTPEDKVQRAQIWLCFLPKNAFNWWAMISKDEKKSETYYEHTHFTDA